MSETLGKVLTLLMCFFALTQIGNGWGKPDLVITGGIPTVTPNNVVPGAVVQMGFWTVKNQGTVDSGKFIYSYYLSTDAIITSQDTWLHSNNTLSNLIAGKSYKAGKKTLKIPPGTVMGNYYIGVLLDRIKGVDESDEENNFF